MRHGGTDVLWCYVATLQGIWEKPTVYKESVPSMVSSIPWESWNKPPVDWGAGGAAVLMSDAHYRFLFQELSIRKATLMPTLSDRS
jgi:hypothetical protein